MVAETLTLRPLSTRSAANRAGLQTTPLRTLPRAVNLPDMTQPLDWEPVLAAIEAGIVKAREDAETDKSLATDGYSAFVILRELHRRGWSVLPIE